MLFEFCKLEAQQTVNNFRLPTLLHHPIAVDPSSEQWKYCTPAQNSETVAPQLRTVKICTPAQNSESIACQLRTVKVLHASSEQ
jgi:hypothetical protein